MSAPFPRAALEHSLARRFRDQAALHAGRVAVRFGGEEVTYAQLLARVRLVAAIVRKHLRGEPGAVALLVPQGIDQVAAILGVLDAGGWYVPLDPAAPAAALRTLVGRAEARLVLAAAATSDLARAACGEACPLARADEPGDGAALEGDAADDPDALAYVYFTSGTTGEPKGVMDSHRNVLHNVMRYTNALGLDPSDRLTLLQDAHFSGAVSNVFGALLNGATLLPYDVGRSGAGAPLARWLEAEAPTVYHSVPSLFRSACLPGARFPSVRIVRLEGDAGAPGDADRLTRHFSSGAQLVHGLGATETGICRQFFVRHGESVAGDVLPIGYPVEDMEVQVVDEAGRAVPPGTAGEIVVRSRHLALGYWRDASRTARAFRDVPGEPGVREYRTGDLGRLRADGCLEHLGRRDLQLKVRGRWLDVSAVEARLAELPGVSEAAVGVDRERDDESVLSAYLVCAPAAAPTFAALRRALSAALPAHAVPTRAFEVAALPLGPNGKLDRRALAPALGRALPDGTGEGAPRDAAEEALVAIWKRVLGREHVGIHDSFLELGGDSLTAVRVALEIERAFGGSVPHGVLLETPTVAELASHLRGAPRARGASTLVPVRTTGSRPPIFCVHDLESDSFLFTPLARRLGPDQPLWALRMPAGSAAGAVPRTLEALARRYLDDLATVAPRGPHALVGFCFGGVVALEMARLLAERGEPVPLLALVNVSAYDLGALVSPAARRRFRRGWGARLRYLRQKPDAARWIARRLARLGEDLAWRLMRPARLAAKGPSAPASEGLVRATLRAAFRAHVARPHAGDVLLMVADETLPLYADDPHEAWAGLASGEVAIRRLPHDGYASLREPEVSQVAGWILERLAGATAGDRSRPARGA